MLLQTRSCKFAYRQLRSSVLGRNDEGIPNLHVVPGFVALPECFTGKYGVSHFASYRYAQLRMLPTSIISRDQSLLFIFIRGDQGEDSLASV